MENRCLVLQCAPINDTGVHTAHCGRAKVEAECAAVKEAEEILNNLASSFLLVVISTNKMQLQAIFRRRYSNETSL
jgi:hypothetical protein